MSPTKMDNIKEIKIVLESHFAIPGKYYTMESKAHPSATWEKIISAIQTSIEKINTYHRKNQFDNKR